jgi:hypothetical protein
MLLSRIISKLLREVQANVVFASLNLSGQGFLVDLDISLEVIVGHLI